MEEQQIYSEMSNEKNIHINLLSLRRSLKLSQSAFLEKFLLDNDEKPILSLAKYSMFERNGGKDSFLICEKISCETKIDKSVFMMNPDGFIGYVEDFFTSLKQPQLMPSEEKKNSQIEQLVTAISDYISDCLISKELKIGDKLPSDRDLAVSFGVGRTAVREALKVLSVLGLIDIRPGQGTFICKNSSNFFLMPLSWGFFMGDQTITDICGVRNVLEVESARLAALNATPQQLEHLTEIFEKSKTAYNTGNFSDFLELDMDFHLSIALCSQNPIIRNLLFTSRKLIKQISKSGMLNTDHLKNIYIEHGIIFDAICQRNPDLATIKMLSHLTNSCARYHIKDTF